MARQSIQHVIDDGLAVVAIGHDHCALPRERTSDHAAAEAGIVAALHGDTLASRAGKRHAEAIAEAVDVGQQLIETARAKRRGVASLRSAVSPATVFDIDAA
jgi:hypothetical protein